MVTSMFLCFSFSKQNIGEAAAALIMLDAVDGRGIPFEIEQSRKVPLVDELDLYFKRLKATREKRSHIEFSDLLPNSLELVIWL